MREKSQQHDALYVFKLLRYLPQGAGWFSVSLKVQLIFIALKRVVTSYRNAHKFIP
jgi:hypothetical protein